MLLETLSNAFGPSGAETEVRRILVRELEDCLDQVQVDALGNLIGAMTGTRYPDFRIMLAAHMDEVGFMISHADDSGLLHFVKVGAIDDRVLPARRVLLGKKKIPGVITAKPVHLTDAGERSRVLGVSQLSIDIGAKTRDEAQNLVPQGTYGVFDTQFEDLGDIVKGKAFDDRMGCAVLAELLRNGPYPCTLVPVFTTMEEIGGRGARAAAYRVHPRAAFVFEGTVCDDVPKKRDMSPTTELRKGPALSPADGSVIADPRLLAFVKTIAEARGISVQYKQPGIGGTDAGPIHVSREGVPALPVSVPCRYIHGPAAIAAKQDFEQTVALMTAVLQEFTPAVLTPVA